MKCAFENLRDSGYCDYGACRCDGCITANEVINDAKIVDPSLICKIIKSDKTPAQKRKTKLTVVEITREQIDDLLNGKMFMIPEYDNLTIMFGDGEDPKKEYESKAAHLSKIAKEINEEKKRNEEIRKAKEKDEKLHDVMKEAIEDLAGDYKGFDKPTSAVIFSNKEKLQEALEAKVDMLFDDEISMTERVKI